jgi:hypothetical protein
MALAVNMLAAGKITSANTVARVTNGGPATGKAWIVKGMRFTNTDTVA